MPNKIKAKQVAFDHIKIAVVDTKGRVWERTEEMPIGKWGAIELPDDPVQDRRPRKRASKLKP